MTDDVAVIRRLFDAVERRDGPAVLACYAEDVEIHETDVLPYGGVWRGHAGAAAHAAGFHATWSRYQGPPETGMDAAIWGDGPGRVCALFRHRAVDHATGARLDVAEVGVYRVLDGRVVRSEMFHSHPAAVARFLADASGPATESEPA